ncbi:unnamed protein product [Closterium sp. Naga37s-1]|nr:unnamed protein product [Closterium sp. Naga37s-1]
MEECAQCGERAVDYDDQALALVCARCGHVADEAQLTSRVEFDELGRAGGVRVGGGGGGGDGGEPRSWMWTAGAGGGRFGGGGWGEGAETKWGGGGKSAEFKRRKNKREWEERLGAVVAGLRVPEGVRGDAVGVAERVLEGRWGSGQWMNVLMAAAVYIAARNRRLPVSMGEVAVSVCCAEVAHATDCELAAVWAMFKRIMAYFPMLQPEQVDPVSHVWRAVHAMPALREWQGEGGRQAIVGDAMRLLTFAHSLSLHTGRHAAPVRPLSHAVLRHFLLRCALPSSRRPTSMCFLLEGCLLHFLPISTHTSLSSSSLPSHGPLHPPTLPLHPPTLPVLPDSSGGAAAGGGGEGGGTGGGGAVRSHGSPASHSEAALLRAHARPHAPCTLAAASGRPPRGLPGSLPPPPALHPLGAYAVGLGPVELTQARLLNACFRPCIRPSFCRRRLVWGIVS